MKIRRQNIFVQRRSPEQVRTGRQLGKAVQRGGACMYVHACVQPSGLSGPPRWDRQGKDDHRRRWSVSSPSNTGPEEKVSGGSSSFLVLELWKEEEGWED